MEHEQFVKEFRKYITDRKFRAWHDDVSRIKNISSKVEKYLRDKKIELTHENVELFAQIYLIGYIHGEQNSQPRA